MDEFRFWCNKVLPLVYDESISYYEVLCKVVKYINGLIEQDKIIGVELEKLQAQLNTVQSWIDNFDASYVEELIGKVIATSVYFGLSDSGYFVATIPQTWNNIKFKTTGLDIDVPTHPEYGHLVLLY